MLIAHKIALGPNNVQATYLKKTCGVRVLSILGAGRVEAPIRSIAGMVERLFNTLLKFF